MSTIYDFSKNYLDVLVMLQPLPSFLVISIFSERHFSRLSRLLQQAMFVEYSWFCMKGVATDGYV